MPDSVPTTAADAWEQTERYLVSREGELPRETARAYKSGHDRGFANGKAGRDPAESWEQTAAQAGERDDLHTLKVGHDLGYQAGAAARTAAKE